MTDPDDTPFQEQLLDRARQRPAFEAARRAVVDDEYTPVAQRVSASDLDTILAIVVPVIIDVADADRHRAAQARNSLRNALNQMTTDRLAR